MNHRHRKVLHALFAHPTSSNIHFSDVEHALKDLGAELDHTSHGRVSVKLQGQTTTFHGGNHELSKDEVAHVRNFITSCGIDPQRDYPL
jgi:hypothetical protein